MLFFRFWLKPTMFGFGLTSVLAQEPLAIPVATPGQLSTAVPGRSNENPIDLATALRLAGVQNPDIQIARERITEAMAQKQFFASQALPNINLGSNFNLHNGPLQQSNGSILNVNRDSMYVGLGANAIGAGTVNIPGVNYNLNVGTAWFNHLRSKQIVNRAVASARTSQNDTLLQVSLTYTELVRAEVRVAIYQQNLIEATELVRLTEAYAKAGQGRKADADRATVELRKRETDLTQANADAVTASAKLARLLNLDSSIRLRPTDVSAVPASIIPEPIPLADLIATALMQRPELEERRAEIRESLYALSNAKLLPFSPNVILGFSTGRFGGASNLNDQTVGNLTNRTDFDAVVFLTFQNLGVGNIAQTRIAASRNRQADLRQQETLNRVRSEVVEAEARTQAKLKQIDIIAKAVESSREAFTQDLTRIIAREGLPIEVIDSMRLLARSRIEYLDAIVDYNRSQFQLYVAIGQPPADALARPVPQKLLEAKPIVHPEKK